MRINKDQINMDGGAVKDNNFISFGIKELANYVFRANQVYDLRMDQRETISEAYEIVGLHKTHVTVEPVADKNKLEKFTSLILMESSQTISWQGKKVCPKVNHDCDEMSPLQKIAFKRCVEGD